MKVALAIPTYNAADSHNWAGVLAAIGGQSRPADLNVIIDSESTDRTVSMAAEKGWMCLRISRERFNHGETRMRIVKALKHRGFDTVVFLSQDARPDGYCAQTCVVHEHASSLFSLFQRGFQIGRFHSGHPELLSAFGKPKVKRAAASLTPRFYLLFFAKAAGYGFGKYWNWMAPCLAVAVMVLLLIPAWIFADFPKRDVASRYAPMAEAFADGDWHFVLHPRIPPLFTLTAGVMIKLFHCGSVLACQLASSFYLAAACFPLFYASKRIYGIKIASVACWIGRKVASRLC